MRYLMTYSHSHSTGGLGFGNATITAPERPTVKQIRQMEAHARKEHGPTCTVVVLLNLIPLADTEA